MKLCPAIACTLALIPAYAGMLGPEQPIAPISPASIPAAEQVRQASTRLAAFEALLMARAISSYPIFNNRLPIKEPFLQGLEEQISKGYASPRDEEMLRAQFLKLERKFESYKGERRKQIDFMALHAAQPGVTMGPDGLQYDSYVSPQPEENYKARRAHRLLARIPGTESWVDIEGMPAGMDNLLYDLPRAAVWRFMTPTQLFDAYLAQAYAAQGVDFLEVLAMRSDIPAHVLDSARQAFDSKQPSLSPTPAKEPELLGQASHVVGRLCGLSLMRSLDGRISAAEARRLTDSQWGEVALERDQAKLDKKLFDLRREQKLAKGLLEHEQHVRISQELMKLQEKLPGTRKMENGTLYRVVRAETGNVPVSEANRMEEEELGARSYFRISDRVISPQDLPERLRALTRDMPDGISWEFVIPPHVLQDEWKAKCENMLKTDGQAAEPDYGPDLPLRYRLWHQKPEETQQAPPQLPPDVI